LTLRNVPPGRLRATVDRIRRSWKKLLKKYKKRWRGGLYVIEITMQSRESGWHVHIHALIEGKFVHYKRLEADWRAITGDSYIVYIEHEKYTPVRNLRYILKDMAKAPKLCCRAAQVEYDRALHGERLVHPFGSWFNAVLERSRDLLRCPVCGSTDLVMIDYAPWGAAAGAIPLSSLDTGPPACYNGATML